MEDCWAGGWAVSWVLQMVGQMVGSLDSLVVVLMGMQLVAEMVGLKANGLVAQMDHRKDDRLVES